MCEKLLAYWRALLFTEQPGTVFSTKLGRDFILPLLLIGSMSVPA